MKIWQRFENEFTSIDVFRASSVKRVVANVTEELRVLHRSPNCSSCTAHTNHGHGAWCRGEYSGFSR